MKSRSLLFLLLAVAVGSIGFVLVSRYDSTSYNQPSATLTPNASVESALLQNAGCEFSCLAGVMPDLPVSNLTTFLSDNRISSTSSPLFGGGTFYYFETASSFYNAKLSGIRVSIFVEAEVVTDISIGPISICPQTALQSLGNPTKIYVGENSHISLYYDDRRLVLNGNWQSKPLFRGMQTARSENYKNMSPEEGNLSLEEFRKRTAQPCTDVFGSYS